MTTLTGVLQRIVPKTRAGGSLLVAGASPAALSIFWSLARFCLTCFTDFNQVYEPVARGIEEGRGILSTYYPPGYSLVLAAVFRGAATMHISEVHALEALFVAASAGGALLLYAIASEIWPQPAALVPPLLWITYPPAIWLTHQPNSELIFCPILFGCVFYAVTGVRRMQLWRFAPAGVLAGLAMLTRPIAIGVPLVIALTLLTAPGPASRRNRIAAAAIVVVTSMVTVLPWQLRVSSEAGQAALLARSGGPSIVDGLTFDVNARHGRVIGVIDDPAVHDLMHAIGAWRESSGDLSVLAPGVASEMGARPRAAVKLIAMKVARSWYGTDSQVHEGITLAMQLVYLPVVLLAGFVGFNAGDGRRFMAILIGLIVLDFWMMTIVVLSILRYMTPAMALLFVLVPALLERRQPTAKRA